MSTIRTLKRNLIALYLAIRGGDGEICLLCMDDTLTFHVPISVKILFIVKPDRKTFLMDVRK
jgi:hypothetical protein